VWRRRWRRWCWRAAIDTRDWGRKFASSDNRFVVLDAFNNEAVLDEETQLVWQRYHVGAAHQ
jgi:hypothetical protein